MAMNAERQESARGRWRMQRAGLLNFWYYDEETFELEEGRLILRGANGSGKSVTMQSFLPLVLDGDKRPHRLDPFGSRDRRIEFYLLGEADSGKNDVTGYLWIEFAHEETGQTKTIGIGLRARRGAAQVQFWGFLLNDGRRIGKDFWLYDRDEWLVHRTRTPYGRSELEKAIGAGGEVVHDQSSYRELVNKQVFGFAEIEAFQDLLHLMLQLRSPKLSKDFKPSAIYEILHSALPPLQEDDLRPLSEVLEDMDQIADRLDELRMHKREMGKLQDAYDRYNKRTLYDLSVGMLERHAEYRDMSDRAKTQEAALTEAKTGKSRLKEEIAVLEAGIQEADAAIDVLDRHEGKDKQQELDAAAAALDETNKHHELAEARIERNQERLEAVGRDAEKMEERRRGAEREQAEAMEELETLAAEIEFAEHSVYQRNWDSQGADNDSRRDAWRRDVRAHRERLEAALRKAQEEREAARAVAELEATLGEARKERDARERERGEAEKALDARKDGVREEIRLWQGTLEELPFGEDELRASFAAIAEFGPEARSLEPIRSAAAGAAAAHRERLAAARLELEHERKALLTQEASLRDEKRMWEESREPEPARSDARARQRASYAAGSGAPLYAVCDFQPHLGEERRARVEEALSRAGLLDAWIFPDGRIGAGAIAEGGEEAWIAPAPHEIGYTLADVLRPTAAPESGLSDAAIDAVLRTFLWVEEGELAGYEGVDAVVSGSGMYRVGPLAGGAASEDRAKYIGKETRQRTRKLEIARLEQEIALLQERIGATDAALAALAAREARLKTEAASFPAGLPLEEGLQRLLEATYRLNAALEHEARASERFKEKTAFWRDVQRQLHELTAAWSRLKREKELQEAAAATKDYEVAVGELYSAWARCREAAERFAALSEERLRLQETLDNDETLLEELVERRRTLRTQIQTLQAVLRELGYEDVARQSAELKEKRKALAGERKEAAGRLEKAKEEAAKAEASLSLYREQEQKLELAFDGALAAWHRDLGFRFVEEWRDAVPELEAREPAVRLAIDIKQRYDAGFAGRHADTVKNNLLELFNGVRSLLAEYVLDSENEEESGRIVILSKRDRSRPQPPSVVLAELQRDEEEQSALLSEKDRELYEEIILRSVGKAIRQRIHRAEAWVRRMNRLMEERNTSSGLRLKLDWAPKAPQHEQQMDTSALVELLKRDSHRLRDDEIDRIIEHFRYQIGYAKHNAQTEKESLRKHLYEVLDYRSWFQFELKYRKGEQTAYRPLTDSRFNVLSGGEKAMAMYIPLFAAAWSRYSDARPDAPRLISLDEAFAGVDEENMRDMFGLLSEMGFDYMMTSQVLWGCYDTVPKLAIYEIHRPKDVDFVTTFHYRWNGRVKEYIQEGDDAS